MSFFKGLFGSSKKEDSNKISSNEAIQRLSNVEEMLSKKQEHLETIIEAEKINALRYSKQGNKRAALLAMQRKKKHEKNLKQIDGTLTTLEIQRETLQNASTNIQIFNVMKNSADAIKNAHQNLDIDDVNALIDDLDEQKQNSDQIAEALSSFGARTSDIYTDADLERELQELAQDDAKQDIINIGTLPDVPIQNNNNQQDDSLRELQLLTV